MNTPVMKKPRPVATVEREIVGKCPECNRDVLVGDTKYYCRNLYYKSKSFADLKKNSCSFMLFRNRLQTLGKTDISPDEMRILLHGHLIPLPGLKRKDGNFFDTYGRLVLKPSYGWSIDFVTPSSMTCE